MKSHSLPAVLAVAFALAFSAATLRAQAAEPAPGLTRAEVMAEYWRARAAGELPSPAQVCGPLLSQALAQSMGGAKPTRMVSGTP